MSYIKGLEDLEKHLKTQKYFIEASSKAYDNGFEDEAQRLSTAIRILVHDTTNSTSLLNQLSIKNKLLFISSADAYLPANLMPYMGLLSLKVTAGPDGGYEPRVYSTDDMPNK